MTAGWETSLIDPEFRWFKVRCVFFWHGLLTRPLIRNREKNFLELNRLAAQSPWRAFLLLTPTFFLNSLWERRSSERIGP